MRAQASPDLELLRANFTALENQLQDLGATPRPASAQTPSRPPNSIAMSSDSDRSEAPSLGTLPGLSPGERIWLEQRAFLLTSSLCGLVSYHGVTRPVAPLAQETVKKIDGLPEEAKQSLSDLRALASRLARDYSYQNTATYAWLRAVHSPGDTATGCLSSSVGSLCSSAAAPTASSLGTLSSCAGGCQEPACAAGAAVCIGSTAAPALSGGLTTVAVGGTLNTAVGGALGLPMTAFTKLVDAFSGKASENAIRGFYADRKAGWAAVNASVEELKDELKSE